MRTNIADMDYLGYGSFKTESSYLLIPTSDAFGLIVNTLHYYKRDYDILEEPLGISQTIFATNEFELDINSKQHIYRLGEFYDRYVLTSDQYISERMIAKIDKVTNSMAEHGFYQFYQSWMEFERKFLSRSAGIFDVEFELKPITIEQLRKPSIIVLCLNGLAVVIFVAEILVFKWLKSRNRKHSIQCWHSWRVL